MNTLRMQIIVWLITFAILASVTIGGMLSSHMMMKDGAMHDCPYMGVTGLCDMTPLEHLSQWQSMFASIAQRLSVFAFLLLLALFIARRLATDLFISAASSSGISRYGHEERVFNSLRLALARGRIHPKSF